MDTLPAVAIPNAIFFNPPIESNYIGHIMAEVYKDKVYDPYLRGKSDLVIVDIGANIGITTYYFSQFAKQVFSIEPAAEHFSILTTMIKFNKLENVTPINKAIYIKEGQYEFYHPYNKTSYSLHQAMAVNSTTPPEKVEAITLDKLFEENKITNVDFLKLDVEGSEAEILSGESFSLVAPMIDTMLIEVHDWNGRHPNQIKDALENNGFKTQTVPNDATLIYAHK